MLKIAALTSALAIGLVSGAYAQTTGPAGQQQDKAGMTNSNSDAMKKDTTTTGMSNKKDKETGW